MLHQIYETVTADIQPDNQRTFYGTVIAATSWQSHSKGIARFPKSAWILVKKYEERGVSVGGEGVGGWGRRETQAGWVRAGQGGGKATDMKVMIRC